MEVVDFFLLFLAVTFLDILPKNFKVYGSSSKFQLEVKSPVSEGYYLQQSGQLITSADLGVVNVESVSLEGAIFCTSYFNLNQHPPNQILKECNDILNGIVFPSFSVRTESGKYAAVFDIQIPVHDEYISETVEFYVGRKKLQESIVGLVPPNQHCTTCSKQSVLDQEEKLNNLLVLGIKYGLHGDDSRITVTLDGKLLLNIPLDVMFQIHDEKLRIELTQSQWKWKTTWDQAGYSHNLLPYDEARLSDHLALQVASGFATGCDGLFVTTAGITRMCDNPANVQERWHQVAHRIRGILESLLGDEVIKRYQDATFTDIAYDAVVFVSAPEDMQTLPSSPRAFDFAKNAFKLAKRWAFEDNSIAVGNPGSVIWASADDLSMKVGVGTYDFNEQSLGYAHDDRTAPLLETTTANTALTIRRLLRRVKSSGKPFTVCRPGLGWDTTLAHRRLVTPHDTVTQMELALLKGHVGMWMFDNSGDDSSDLNQYLDEWNDALLNTCDVNAVFPATEGRISDYCLLGLNRQSEGPNWRHCEAIDGRILAGYAQISNPDTWFHELQDLRVLVIYPFASSIKAQYDRHLEYIHHGIKGGLFYNHPNALPVFKELLTLVPPVGGDKGEDWRIAFEFAKADLRKLANKFDIALIGAGGWGPLLQKFIKKDLGLSSIYLGGALQSHFAIHGGRLNTTECKWTIVNENWIWPLEEETNYLKENIPLGFGEYGEAQLHHS